jgi:hypothetical protein
LPDEGEGAITGDVIGEGTVNADSAEQSWFAEVKTWAAENFSGLAVALAAIWAVIPKVGGIAVLIKWFAKIAALFAALKTYIDDQGNENSIYNVMKRQGDAISKFMNDMAPALETLTEDKKATEELTQRLAAAMALVTKQRGMFLAIEEAVELMAAEFSDLISISTTISQKKKAELEQKWMDAEARLRAAVKEAAGNDENGEKASA